METGNPVSSRSSVSRPGSSDPPPASTMPRSTMSAASSGGVRSSAILTVSTMVLIGSQIDSRTSSSVMIIVFGIPVTRSRPLISRVIFSSVGYAEPI